MGKLKDNRLAWALWNARKQNKERRNAYPKDGLLGMYDIGVENGYLTASYPASSHTVQQVKGSAFTGAGSATVAGLLTTDTITATGVVPTCTVDGTLTFGGGCWDVYVHRGGVLWAYWPGINVGETSELDASGNGNHLADLATAVISEFVDGSGSNYCNDSGFSSVAVLGGTI